jgi:hypothetical protein
MQFGKIQGAVLGTLGVVLIALQIFLSHPFATVVRPSGENPTATLPDSSHFPLAGIIGGICVLVGASIYFTARRKDEPNPRT